MQGDLNMRRLIIILIIACVGLPSITCLAGDTESPSNIEQNEAKHDKLLRRIDFGSSYIMGQTIKSGAVYLLRRKQSEIKSMLKRRKDYRKEILEDFYVQNMNSD
jgi:hypothetical protein